MTLLPRQQKGVMKVYRLHLQLCTHQPDTWRIVEVREDATWQQLHEQIQQLFGWEDQHPWALGVEEESVGEGPFDRYPLNSQIGEALSKQRFEACYQYDFPEYWEVWIRIQQITLINTPPLFRLIDSLGESPGEL